VLLRSLDADYFTFQGRQFARSLETEDAQRAAVALRSAYSHALETFFALLFAAIQAPDCVPAWLALYQPAELVALVDWSSATICQSQNWELQRRTGTFVGRALRPR